jgi:uncharacterized membrane protein YtjA (UPF0391 family)
VRITTNKERKSDFTFPNNFVFLDYDQERKYLIAFGGLLYWAVIFLVIAIIAALLGLGGIAGFLIAIAQILFIVFIVLFVIALIVGLVRR